MKASVTWGLLAAWALHDVEELVTMAGWVRKRRAKLEQRFPAVPPKVWDRLDVSQPHVNVSLGLMAGVMTAASAAGAISGGRNGFYQATLAGFGVHGAIHLLQAAAVRGYTPGVITAPIVVIPFSVWAWRQLDVPKKMTASSLAGLALFPVVLAGVHGLAHVLTTPRERWF